MESTPEILALIIIIIIIIIIIPPGSYPENPTQMQGWKATFSAKKAEEVRSTGFGLDRGELRYSSATPQLGDLGQAS